MVISHNSLIEIYLLVLLLLCFVGSIKVEMGYIFQLSARQAVVYHCILNPEEGQKKKID